MQGEDRSQSKGEFALKLFAQTYSTYIQNSREIAFSYHTVGNLGFVFSQNVIINFHR